MTVTVTVFGYLILILNISTMYFSVVSLVLVPNEKIYQTFKTVFDHISKHLEVRQKYSATPGIFNSFLCDRNVVKHGLSCSIYYLLNLATYR